MSGATGLGRHECNALCRPTDHLHCDLAYAPAGYSAESVAGSYWWGDAHLWVERIEPATEAPPLSAIPPDRREELGNRPVTGEHRAWLVWWLTPAEYDRRARARKAARRAQALARIEQRRQQ